MLQEKKLFGGGFIMSVVKDLANKQFWLRQIGTVGVLLMITAMGALLIVLGVWDAELPWVWVCVAWFAAGLRGGGSVGEKNEYVIKSLVSVGVAAGAMWALGLTVSGSMSADTRHWLWFAGCAVAGAISAALLPQSRKRRKKGQRKGKKVRR